MNYSNHRPTLPSNVSGLVLGSLEFIRPNMHSNNSMKMRWEQNQFTIKEFDSELAFFWNYDQKWLQIQETQIRYQLLAQSDPESGIGGICLECN